MPFRRPTIEELEARAVADVRSRLGVGPLLARGPLAVLARLVAGAAHLLHAHLGWVARQVMPDTAESEHLERWGTIWGVTRKAATFATGTVDFTGADGSEIAQGTRVRSAAAVEYEITAKTTIVAGAATTSVSAILAGQSGDLQSGSPLTLVSPVAGVQSTATSGAITGGEDAEDDEALRARLLARLREPPRGGAAHDNVAWALEVAGVTRAWAFENYLGVGTVGLAFVEDEGDGGILPDAAAVAAVQDYVDARRPVTADLTVFAPTLQAIDFEIQLTPATAATQAAVQAALADLLTRVGAPGGTVLLSRIREAISTTPGESDHVLVAPAANVDLPAGALPSMGVITWS